MAPGFLHGPFFSPGGKSAKVLLPRRFVAIDACPGRFVSAECLAIRGERKARRRLPPLKIARQRALGTRSPKFRRGSRGKPTRDELDARGQRKEIHARIARRAGTHAGSRHFRVVRKKPEAAVKKRRSRDRKRPFLPATQFHVSLLSFPSVLLLFLCLFLFSFLSCLISCVLAFFRTSRRTCVDVVGARYSKLFYRHISPSLIASLTDDASHTVLYPDCPAWSCLSSLLALPAPN